MKKAARTNSLGFNFVGQPLRMHCSIIGVLRDDSQEARLLKVRTAERSLSLGQCRLNRFSGCTLLLQRKNAVARRYEYPKLSIRLIFATLEARQMDEGRKR